MKSFNSLLLALGSTLALGLAVLVEPVGAKTHVMQFALPGPSAAAALDACEREILRNPFPSQHVQMRLAAGLGQALEESRQRGLKAKQELQESDTRQLQGEHHLMGWTVSDEAYLAQIPPGARNLPVDLSRFQVLRFTNTEIGGVREIGYMRGREYDQWLLSDPEREITACISVHRKTRQVYFMQLTRHGSGSWDYAVAFDKCYSCHVSGPRVIRPLDEPQVDRNLLARFNRVILSYGACDFGDSVDAPTRGAPHSDARCGGCHDGKRRGRLYAIHERSIKFKTEVDLTMPPPAGP